MVNVSGVNFTTLYSNNCSNHELERILRLPLPSLIGLTLFNTLFAVTGTFGNILVLLAVMKNSCLQTVTDLFIFSLASADLIVTSVRQPLIIYDLYNQQTDNKNVAYDIFRTVSYISTPAAVTCMFAVTIDRFFAIRRPFRYALIVTKRRALMAIAMCWGLSVMVAMGFRFLLVVTRYFMWVCMAVSLLATLGIYVYLFAIAKQHQNKIVNLNGFHLNNANINRQKHERKATKTIALVVGVFITFYIPFLVYPFAAVKRGEHFYQGYWWVYSLCLWNSSINPYIYCARNSRYRDAFSKLLRLKTN
ncbi:hypothetical protein QZH41_006945 [Actinostola sp. cb2023]|nr:hypothetical protein QZH41_006945 [Actinostola sp. cb2023]